MAENNSTTYSKEFTVYVSRETVAKVRRFLMADSEDTYQGDGSSIVLAVPMDERHTFHISCHGRDDAPSYMEAELTDCGRTIQRIPYPSRKYLTGDWVLSCKEGSFKLTVEASTLRFMNGQVQDVHQGIIVHALSIDTSLYCPYNNEIFALCPGYFKQHITNAGAYLGQVLVNDICPCFGVVGIYCLSNKNKNISRFDQDAFKKAIPFLKEYERRKNLPLIIPEHFGFDMPKEAWTAFLRLLEENFPGSIILKR